jgi:uncharacterized protein YlxW (UPF0749 family)
MLEKQKSWFVILLGEYKKPLSIIIIGIVCVICLVLAFNSFGKNYVTEIINDLIKQQVELIEQNYLQSMEARDKQVQELQKRLLTSEKTYNDLKKRVGNVEKRIEERKPPATAAELKDRLNQLGYPPVN